MITYFIGDNKDSTGHPITAKDKVNNEVQPPIYLDMMFQEGTEKWKRSRSAQSSENPPKRLK